MDETLPSCRRLREWLDWKSGSRSVTPLEERTDARFRPRIFLCSQCPYGQDCELGQSLLATEPQDNELLMRFVSTAEGLTIIADGHDPELCERVLLEMGIPREAIAWEWCG
jgi:hypothetical protein